MPNRSLSLTRQSTEMIRTQYTLAMIAAAVGVPYTASETEFGRNAMRSFRGQPASLITPAPASSDGVNSHRDVERIWESDVGRYRYASMPLSVASTSGMAPGTDIQPLPPQGLSQGYQQAIAGTRINDLREVLRFDVSPDWVMANFSRVTTVLAELELEGLRVPIVTGTGTADLAGSITYYFDRSGRLQRVMLHAFTGDASKVVATMTENYGLQAEPSLDAGVYTRRWNGVPVHFLRLTRAPVVYSDALHHKLTVYLELNQPDLAYGISTEAQRIISSDQNTGRW